MHQVLLTWPDGPGPDTIVDDGGDATLLVHEGFRAKIALKMDGSLPHYVSTDNSEFKIVLKIFVMDSLRTASADTRLFTSSSLCLKNILPV